MGRAKLTMELIKKEKTRNTTFEKRRNCLKKKVYELSTLCGVKSTMIIYGPKQTPEQDHPLQPDIWPQDHAEVLELINKYKGQNTDERKTRTSLLSDFFEERNKKAHTELTKLRKSNVQAKYPSWDQRYNSLPGEQLIDIARYLEKKLGCAKKFKFMKENANHLQQQRMLSKKRSMDFEGSHQANKVFITTDSREPIYNSYNSHLPTPLQMHIPMTMPLQQHTPTLDPCTIQKLSNAYVGGASNMIYTNPPAKAETNMTYNDPLAGMADSISNLNYLIRAPRMHYFGDSMQPMAQNYIDGARQSMPQNYIDGARQPMPQNYIDGARQPMPQNYIDGARQLMPQNYIDGARQPMPQNYIDGARQPMPQNYIDGARQPMPQNYIDGARQPMPQNYVEYPIRSSREAASSQMLAAFPCQKDDHEGYYEYEINR